MTDQNLMNWVAFASLRLSPRQLSKLRTAGVDLKSLMADDAATRATLVRLGYDLSKYQALAPRQAQAAKLLEWCHQKGWSIVPCSDSAFPPLLTEIADPPMLLFCKGDQRLLKEPQVALVGSRNSSTYGENIAFQIASDLSKKGVVVTSGLALGIDRCAHQGALTAQGATVAVMATGPDRIYPTRNQRLADEIVDRGGLLVTEKLLGTQPKPYLFPERNRLIAGLSLGTLVVEANPKSGSLITARMALEQGRDVMAVPGSLTNPRSRGCHKLIQQGAMLVESAQDVIQFLYPQLKGRISDSSELDGSEQVECALTDDPLLVALETDSLSLDQLAQRTGLGISQLAVKIAEFELEGWVVQRGGKYTRVK